MVLVDPIREVLKTRATRLTFIGQDKELDICWITTEQHKLRPF